MAAFFNSSRIIFAAPRWRLTMPTASRVPVDRASATMAAASAADGASGFSQRTAIPARSAATPGPRGVPAVTL